MAWLGHPVTLLALVALIVNDHLLKALYPGWVTGKLSDAAGLVLAPPLVAVVTRLRWQWATALVGLVFTLIKTFPPAAALASDAGTAVAGPSLVRVDPTDLLALPFLALSWLAWRSTRGRAATPNWVRALRLGVLLPIALLGVAATGALPAPTADQVLVHDGGIYLFAHDQDAAQSALSIDDGRSWIALPDQPGWARAARELPVAEDPAVDDRACSARQADICYRVVPGALAVRTSTDGGATWQDDWRVSEKDRKILQENYADGGGYSTVGAVSVAILDVPQGQVVVVATGRDGFAERSADGRWRRIGFPALFGSDGGPPPGLGHKNQPWMVYDLLFVGGTVLVIGLIVTGLIVAVAVRVRRRAP